MIDIQALKRKTRADEYIGTRIDVETKSNLESFCKTEGVSVSTLLTALVREFLKTKGM